MRGRSLSLTAGHRAHAYQDRAALEKTVVAMTEREKPLLRRSAYPDTHGDTPGHDDRATTLLRR
ncbi:hypothetical protein CCS01_06215 [Rhodopila globiformis]|uniref:Uncharacterized protein n=1 Tax=Rhodopila globiformis TaxID=1071 RepID=A0A2S6NL47_RHOGL|nr:hypothetical protein CCS01_06215 [Rhodopila globiformis]